MKIRVTENFRTIFYAPFYATQALGLYSREGIDVELIDSSVPGSAISALIDGTLDLTWGGPMRVMKAHDEQSNSPLVSFCEVVSHDPFYLIGRVDRANLGSRIYLTCDLPQFPKCQPHGCVCNMIYVNWVLTRTDLIA